MIAEHLRKIFPGTKLLADEKSLVEYSSDITEAEPRLPSAVILSEGVDDVVNAVRAASELKVSITPRCYNLNVGGLAIPAEGGIVLDLKGMNRIVSLDAENMIAVIEPGVTQAQMKERLERDAPGLTIGYSLAPPETSILANCIMDGLTNLSLK
ncbi:MAG: FAD-binding oxidoreductase [Deltaproteobacteria bacterium]|nr:FAD-binding oxidoreductase [Deltaproteobacteria bacterium]